MMWIGFIIGFVIGGIFVGLVAAQIISDLNRGHDAQIERLRAQVTRLARLSQ